MTDFPAAEHWQKHHFDEQDIVEVEEEIDQYLFLPSSSTANEFHPLLRTGDRPEDGNASTEGNESYAPPLAEETTYFQLPGWTVDDVDEDGLNGDVDTADTDSSSSQSPSDTALTHGKSSHEKDYSPSTLNPTHYPTASPIEGGGNSGVGSGLSGSFQSLKNLHEGDTRDGLPADLVNTAVHQKHSKEKNAKNPDELPEGWSSPAPTKAPTAAEEDEVQRVNAAPDQEEDESENDDSEGKRECKSNNGGVFGDDRQSSKNGGVVLRYRYELVQDLSYLDSDLTEDILPLLEEAVSDWLLPAFFPDECLEIDIFGMRRLQYGNLRGLQSVNIVGLSGAPPDLPLDQEECYYDYSGSSSTRDVEHECHVVDGSVTIYFPPNRPASTLLSATTLTTLRSIQDGMNSQALAKMSHPAILQLTFLESSYTLVPVIPASWGLTENNQVVKSRNANANAGAIAAGVLIPLLLFCCCAAGGFVWWRRQQDLDYTSVQEKDVNELSSSSDGTGEGGDDDDTEDDPEDSIQDKILLWTRFRQNQKSSTTSAIAAEKKEAKRRLKDELRRRPPSTSTEESATNIDKSFTSSSGADTNTSSAEASTTTDGSTTTDDDTSTEGSTTTDEESTTDESTTDTDKDNSTTTSSSSSSSSSDSDSDSEDDDAVSGIMPSKYYMDPNYFNLDQDLQMLGSSPGIGLVPGGRRRKLKKKGGPVVNTNIFMTGKHDDEISVATGVSGVSGIISVASEKTAKASNRIAVGGDDNSVATGLHSAASESTAKVANTTIRPTNMKITFASVMEEDEEED
mmetsp:Transcript_9307/g.19581  ORF Transcript_9307/g.19581 Transcript_9307/m.19581 type:complete len:795 (-) Transcript_9307:130-2514(-)